MDSRLLMPKRNVNEMSFEQRRDLLGEITRSSLRLLSKRAEFRTNPVIYEKGALGEGFEDISLLEYAINEKEGYYKKMGRYRHETRYSIIEGEETTSPFYGVEQKNERFKKRIEIPNFLEFYKSLIDDFCEDGENPGRTSQIADLDVDCLDQIHTRLQFGRYIIDGKIESIPELNELVTDYTPKNKEDVLSHIVFKEQENRVVEAAIDYSLKNDLGFKVGSVRKLIKNFIDINTNVQFMHLKEIYGVDLEKT
ncbi:hypothetical protein GOV05_01370 [Candidatus Woesearchaeota archaeon]|nr:hypothetical protein [Candidatus Woesearchaeota archaeon]